MLDIITGKTRPDDGQVPFDGRTDLTKWTKPPSPIWASAASSGPPCSKTARSGTLYRNGTEEAARHLRDPVLHCRRQGHRPHHRNPRNRAPARPQVDYAPNLSHGQKRCAPKSASCWRRTLYCSWSMSPSPA
ncbi:hypothetical protein [Devosia ginsengisoli]|uniref:hypothetical protein n=1 Tax=Devosia ginsengisoli TaxID=400770 RepID=UPI0034E93E5A